MKQTKTLRIDPSAECKRRVAAIKSKLPSNVRELIIADHKEYDTIQGGRLISNVMAGSSSDLKLTEILEKIAARKGGKNANA